NLSCRNTAVRLSPGTDPQDDRGFLSQAERSRQFAIMHRDQDSQMVDQSAVRHHFGAHRLKCAPRFHLVWRPAFFPDNPSPCWPRFGAATSEMSFYLEMKIDF